VIRQIKFEKDNATRTLLVRMVAQGRDGEGAVVVTFDDITAMLSTQRLAAWADVAQRLAHEIKNPLTPIQLSAERIKRKYGKQIIEDKELFSNLTDTIVHQVGDMRQMLNEFSDFARMPAAKFARIDVVDVIDEALTLQKEARTDFNFELHAPKEKLFISGDRNHLQRAITNIFENAINAISEETEKNDAGSIKVVVEKTQSGKITISVIDNGPGLPADVEVEKLFDPYITKRKNGTGLGLAIVKKVVDEHQGSVKLIRQKTRGTKVELIFPLYEE
jgi:two-component system nitrogen regulation sensor histidine kinase NtrY